MIATVIYLTACNNPQNESANYQKTIDSLKAIIADDHSSEAVTIMKTDSAWSVASQANSVEGWLSFYTPDALVMPPAEKMHTDKESVDKSTRAMFALPGMSLKWQTKKAEVSHSGDIGYSVGVYQWKSKDAKGKDYNETGDYTEVWKKQPDGNWKCIVDIWNADTPPAK